MRIVASALLGTLLAVAAARAQPPDLAERRSGARSEYGRAYSQRVSITRAILTQLGILK
jgi:hypothetical protein